MNLEDLQDHRQRAEFCESVTLPGALIRAILDEAIHALTELDTAERALIRAGYRKSCDISVCNCGSQWGHGGHADQRLREISDALPYENGKTILARINTLVALASEDALLQAYEKGVADERSRQLDPLGH